MRPSWGKAGPQRNSRSDACARANLAVRSKLTLFSPYTTQHSHHETASMEKFSWGVASRKCSVRVGNDTFQKNKGYYEDRRPAANMDPYVVTSLIFKNSILA